MADGGIAGGYIQGLQGFLQAQEMQRRIAAQQQQERAQRALMASLLSPDGSMLPQQGPPGMSSPASLGSAQPPPTASLPPSLPTGPGGASMLGPKPPAQPPLAGAGAPPAAGPATPSPAGGGLVQDPVMRLRQMAMTLKRANPGMDNATLYSALTQQIDLAKGLAPDDRLLMQGQIALMKFQEDRNRDDLKAALAQMADATKQRGQNITFELGSERNDLARQRLQAAQSELASKSKLGPASLAFYAEELRAGNIQGVNQVLGFSRNRGAIMDQIVQEAQRQDPSFDGAAASAALAQFGGERSAARVVGTTAGRVAVGAAELPQIAAKVDEASKHLNLSQYPNINAIVQAYQRRAGTPEEQKWLQEYVSYIQTARNAYQQIAARGGQITNEVRHQGEELLNGTMSPAALKGALEAFAAEAEIVKGATGEAMQDVTRRGGGGSSVPPASGDTGGWSIRPVQ